MAERRRRLGVGLTVGAEDGLAVEGVAVGGCVGRVGLLVG